MVVPRLFILSLEDKTGCLTCKSRHLKCDEGQPRCLRCIKARLECRRTLAGSGGLDVVCYVSTPAQAIATWPSLNTKERELFHIFQTRTGLELAAVHSHEIWLRYMLSIAISEPVIKHAILAITVLHKKFQDGKNVMALDEDATYALHHYTNAISHLVQAMSARTMNFPDTPLIACILFCAFESISYDLDSAVFHAGSGIKMFIAKQRAGKRESSRAIPLLLLNSLFTRLDTQGLELGETSLVRQKQYDNVQVTDIFAFLDIEEAQTTFDELVNALLHAMHDVDREEQSSLHSCMEAIYTAKICLESLVQEFYNWCEAFDRFVSRCSGHTDLAPYILLQIWRILIVINLAVDLRTSELDFDRFNDGFGMIVDLSVAFVLLQQSTKVQLDANNSCHDASSSRTAHTIHQSTMCGDSLRGGYLGVHPQCTPFVPGDTFDWFAIQHATWLLLERSQTLYPHHSTDTKLDEAAILQYAPQPSYCFSPGIVSPLYVVISRCRDPSIRRRALDLMQRCRRREGLWDSELAAHLGRRVVEIEEQRAKELNGVEFEASSAFGDTAEIRSADQIPNNARVRMIKPTFLPDRRSIERYYIGWPAANDVSGELVETWIEEILEW